LANASAVIGPEATTNVDIYLHLLVVLTRESTNAAQNEGGVSFQEGSPRPSTLFDDRGDLGRQDNSAACRLGMNLFTSITFRHG
jgi:hypothetical protein